MSQTRQGYGFNSFLIFFTKKLRLSNPWNFKAPLLITFPYLVFLLSNYAATNSFIAILFSITVIIGVAGLGYLSNDLGDRKNDERIGKENVLVGMKPQRMLMLFLLFFVLTVLPWLYLPFNKLGALFLVLQVFLFYVYAMPPFRFKERGVLGVITDSLYAHVLPGVLAAYTFYLFCGSVLVDFIVFVILVFSWQFVQGVRNILFHQVKDFEADQKSDTVTFVRKLGVEKSIHYLKKIIIPSEALLFIAFLLFVSLLWGHYFILLFSIIYFAVTFLSNSSQLPTMDYRARAYKFLDDFYINWLPLFVLVELSFNAITFLPVLLLHVLLFKNGIKSMLKNKFAF